jgi:hypothetical protein
MEPTTERVAFNAATLERSSDSVPAPDELKTMFEKQLRADLFGTPDKPGPFTEGPGLTIRVKVVQFEGGNQFQRWMWGGIGNAGEASMQLSTDFLQGEKKLSNIQTEGRIGSGFFGGSVESAVQKAAEEISKYAVQTFAEPARAEAYAKGQ